VPLDAGHLLTGGLAQAVPDTPRWFQLYVFKDRGLSRDLVQRASGAGYEALVVTVDLPLFGIRERELRSHVRSGAAGVIVSNHGGRQLDSVLSGADALPKVVAAVGGRADVLVDGGIRRGTDVVKALALGARAVLIGRPVVSGLAVEGAEGVRRVMEILLGELDNALGLIGAPRAAELDSRFITAAPWARR
jgi:isopentenyl diphosphate isomerase/L-lactate dehydrogenase-like FMN-dependent dehydrogenase